MSLICQPTNEDMKLYIIINSLRSESRRDQEEGGDLDSHEEVRLICGSRRDQEEEGELDSHEEVRIICGSRRDQEEGGDAGSSS